MLMPDHVHLFARAFLEAKPLADWVGTWKSLSSRKITIALSATPPFWQKNYFDRFVRSTDDYEEKWRYVEMNPVRKGLCSQSAEWPWQGELFDLRYCAGGEGAAAPQLLETRRRRRRRSMVIGDATPSSRSYSRRDSPLHHPITSLSPFTLNVTMEFSSTSPAMSARASVVSICRCRNLFNGRAPNTGS